LVIGIDPTIGGNDIINDGVGADTIVGGTGNDTITADVGQGAVTDGQDIVIGDSGFVDFAVTDQIIATLDRVWTTDPGTGGADSITTGNSSDIVLGGDAADTIVAGNGDNIVLGDNGQVTYSAGKLLKIVSTATGENSAAQGGDDHVTTGAGNDIVI